MPCVQSWPSTKQDRMWWTQTATIDGFVWDQMKNCNHMLVVGCQNYLEDAELQFGREGEFLVV